MVVDRANCGAEVNEAPQEDPPWRNNFTGKGELADEGEERLFGACSLGIEVRNGCEEFLFALGCDGCSHCY